MHNLGSKVLVAFHRLREVIGPLHVFFISVLDLSPLSAAVVANLTRWTSAHKRHLDPLAILNATKLTGRALEMKAETKPKITFRQAPKFQKACLSKAMRCATWVPCRMRL